MIPLGEGRTRGREFEPVQRALPGQRFLDLPLAGQHGQQRIVAQLLVVVQVFITQRQPVDALRQHPAEFVLDPPRLTMVGETAHHPLQQPDLAIRLPQQQAAAVGGQPAAVEPPHHLPRKMRFKRELNLSTLCHEKAAFLRTFTT